MRHGSPEDRGSADYYYGRPFDPHYYENGVRILKEQMTPDQIAEYTKGYNEETERKDYR